MKILLLSPYIDAQHKISMQLQAAGAVLLFPMSVDEAWKMIQVHGASLDLAVIHREGEKDGAEDEGTRLIEQVKTDPAQADLPMILSSSLWNEGDFYQHQQSQFGVNAYLRWPFEEQELIETIEAMFGNSIRFAGTVQTSSSTHPGTSSDKTSAGAESSPLASMGVVLEETHDDAFLPPRPPSESGAPMELQLEAPDSISSSSSNLSETGRIEIRGGESEMKLELSGAPSQLSAPSALSLTAPGETEQASAVLEFAPPPPAPVNLEPASPPDSSAITSPASISEDGTLDISGLMNEDLEPHERLELEQQKRSQSAPEPDFGTTVLDPAELGVAISSAQGEAPYGAAPSRGSGQDPEADGGSEEDLATELPYLFQQKKKTNEGSAQVNSNLVFAEAVGDAVVPGGAVHSPDIETLKKYLLLREQDVAILSNQLKSAREQVGALEKQLKEEKGRNLDLTHTLGERQRRIDEFEKEKTLALEGLQAEIDELKFQNKAKADKARVMESQVREATDEIERLKERVRNDIRKIRVREKELENKLEIVKKDSEALISARETKIIELKRKIDLLEFNMDLLQDQYTREKENSVQLRERLARAAQVVRVAGGLLDNQAKGEGDAADAIAGKKTEREAS